MKKILVAVFAAAGLALGPAAFACNHGCNTSNSGGSANVSSYSANQVGSSALTAGNGIVVSKAGNVTTGMAGASFDKMSGGVMATTFTSGSSTSTGFTLNFGNALGVSDAAGMTQNWANASGFKTMH